MRIGVTGTPGVGKSSIAKELGTAFKCKVVSERSFALRNKIGKMEGRGRNNELVVPLEKYGKALNKMLARERNVVVEGHLLCEIRAKLDFLVLLRCGPLELEKRLSKRKYSAEKALDNVFCEETGYCKKHALRNYSRKKIIEALSRKSIKETSRVIITELKEKGT